MEMRELTAQEVQDVNGGNPLVVLGAAVLIYNASNILYEFGQGVVEGYKANDLV